MKQLENYGVQELNAREMESTDGGWNWRAAGRALAYVAVSIAIHVVEGVMSPLLPNPRQY